MAPINQSLPKNNKDLIESVTGHNIKLGDKNEQVLTVAAED